MLAETIADWPVTLINGPRRCGKSTLAQEVGQPLGYSYFTLDDTDTRKHAQYDPVGFVGDFPDRVILGEVQLAPNLFRTLKYSIDKRRKPGRLLLTCSSSVLIVPELIDALVGRMTTIRLYPLSQHEIELAQAPIFLDRLFAGDFNTRRVDRLAGNLVDRVVAGGYPEALAHPSGRKRKSWVRNYTTNVVPKDVRHLARIYSVEALPELLAAAARLSGQLLNVSTMASQLQMNRNTVRDYLSLLERQFMIERLLPWRSNRMSRLIKTPKIHIGDTGLACAILGADSDTLRKNRGLFEQLLESFVFQELSRQASSSDHHYVFYHMRDRDGVEVDMIVERGAFEIAGIQVKAAATVFNSDFKGLRRIKAACGDQFTFGAVLYDGEICASFGDGMFAVPIRMLWEDYS